jgi:hypothetical protein
MAFNLSEFRSQVNKKGVAKNNLFEFNMTTPKVLQGNAVAGDLKFWCRSVKIPDMTLSQMGVARDGYGPKSSVAMGTEFDTVNAIFIMDGDFDLAGMFHLWQQRIFNYDIKTPGDKQTASGLGQYELEYKENYQCTVVVKVYSGHSEQSIYEFKFHKVWPATVSNPEVAWENNADIMTLPVTFKYSGVEFTGSDSPVGNVQYQSGNIVAPRVLNFLNQANKIRGNINNIQNTIKNIF